MLATALIAAAICPAAMAKTSQATLRKASPTPAVVNKSTTVEGHVHSLSFGRSPLKPLGVLAATLAVAGYSMRTMARGFDSLLDQ